MKFKFLNTLKSFFVIFFFLCVFLFFIFESFVLQATFPTKGLENFSRIINGFILCIIPFLFLVFFGKKNKCLWYFIFSIFCLYYFLLSFLLKYFFTTGSFFDINFFIDSLHEAFFTLSSIFSIVDFIYILLFFIFFAISFFISTNFIISIKSKFQNILKYAIFILLIILIFFVGLEFKYNYEKPLILDFVGTLLVNNDVVYKQYKEDYNLITNRYFNFNIGDFSIKEENTNLPDVYFIHLESISGDFMNKNIIPNFDNYSTENGVTFDNFYSNSMQTLRVQESILCALPPSMGGYFQYQFNAKNLLCLPKIFNKFGYKTFFFKSHSLEFSETGKFMEDIGFSEIHNGDIMKNEDTYYKWGFKEDIFYKRVLENLKQYEDQKKFVYIAVSTTNHYPFVVYDKLDNLPVKYPISIVDRIKNTTYIQDQYLQAILDELKKDNREKYVFLFSDHPWPINEHKGNVFNEIFAYKENFYVPFAFIYFGKNQNDIKLGNRIPGSYNQIDFLKTILDLYKIETKNKYLGNSFYCELFKNKKECNINNCFISVQPYSNKYITLFYENKHYIYDIKKKQAYYFDLLYDKKEEQQKNISQEEFLGFYDKCKSLMGY